jgi:uncharacterized protein YlxW (UPF0749 family)
MKERFKWMLDIADKKPILFVVFMLLVAVSVLTAVVQNRENKIDRLEEEVRLKDKVCQDRVNRLNDEVKDMLNAIISEYRQRLEEQKRLNDTVKTTIIENKEIISQKNSTK